MAKAKTHKDVEFSVDLSSTREEVFNKFDDAASFALTRAVASGNARLNVMIHSKAGARWYGGDDAVQQYEEDPDASAFEAFDIKVNALGRIP